MFQSLSNARQEEWAEWTKAGWEASHPHLNENSSTFIVFDILMPYNIRLKNGL